MWANRVVEAVGALAPAQAALVDVKVQAVRRGAGARMDPPLGDRVRIQASQGVQQRMQALDGCLDRVAWWGSLQEQRRTPPQIPLLGRSHMHNAQNPFIFSTRR